MQHFALFFVITCSAVPANCAFAQFAVAYSQRTGRSVPENLDSWFDYAQSVGVSTQLGKYDQIFRDLSVFRDPDTGTSLVTTEQLETISKAPHIFECRTRNGTLSGAGPVDIIRVIVEIRDLLPKNADFFFSNLDEPRVLPSEEPLPFSAYPQPSDMLLHNRCLRERYGSLEDSTSIAYQHQWFHEPLTAEVSTERLPIFSQCKVPCMADIVFPGRYHISGQRINDPYAWDAKRSAVVWRGSTTGAHFTTCTKWDKMCRMRLVEWGANQADDVRARGVHVDIAFTTVQQAYDEAEEYIRSHYRFGDFLSYDQQLECKYLIVVDGNAWASRFVEFLHSNSVVFYNGLFVEWFSDLVHPWVHYIPFAPDCSDLSEKILWAVEHDEEAKQIAINARLLAESHLRHVDLQCYFALLLIEYGELVKHLYQ